MSEPQYPTERCPAALTIPVPDEDRLRDTAAIAQCEKLRGHPGKHRSDPRLVWAGTYTPEQEN